MLKYVTQPDIIDVKKLPRPEELYALLKRDESIPDMRRQEICEAYSSKIRMYQDFMNGAPLWEYQYRK